VRGESAPAGVEAKAARESPRSAGGSGGGDADRRAEPQTLRARREARRGEARRGEAWHRRRRAYPPSCSQPSERCCGSVACALRRHLQYAMPRRRVYPERGSWPRIRQCTACFLGVAPSSDRAWVSGRCCGLCLGCGAVSMGVPRGALRGMRNFSRDPALAAYHSQAYLDHNTLLLFALGPVR